MEEKSQAMNYLFKISFKTRPDIMLAAAEMASKVIIKLMSRKIIMMLSCKS
jgi:hypothetical protein